MGGEQFRPGPDRMGEERTGGGSVWLECGACGGQEDEAHRCARTGSNTAGYDVLGNCEDVCSFASLI